MSHNAIEAGIKILCPRKRHVIGSMKEPIQNILGFTAGKVDFENGQERVAGELNECKICQSVYFLQGKLYTELGWLPQEPQLEKSNKR